MPGPDPVAARRALLHLGDGRRVPLDPAEIFLLNRILPIARGRAEALWGAHGERGE